MNADKLIKVINEGYYNDEVIQEFMDNIHPEKYITKANILKLIERNKNRKRTNLESIKDEDKIIAYLFIQEALGLNIADFGEKLSSLSRESCSRCYEICNKLYNIVGIKYSPLIFSIYDEISNLNNILANFSTKYNISIGTTSSDKTYLRISNPENKFSDKYISITYKDIEDLVQNLSLLDKKLENWFEFRNKILKTINKYEDLKKDSLFAKSENIHDTQYIFHTYVRYDYLESIEYRVNLCQKYHEKEVYIINVAEYFNFKSDEFISKLDNIKIDDIIDNIKTSNGKPYEYEITIENLPSSQYLMDSTSAAIMRVTKKDGSDRDGNFYALTRQIDENILLDITDSYAMAEDRNNCGQGRMGIVMSVFYFNEDFDIHTYLSKLKTLYYQNIERYQCSLSIADKEDFYAAFDNASVSDLGQTRKELVKLL